MTGCKYIVILFLFFLTKATALSQIYITDITGETIKVKIGTNLFLFKPGMSFEEILAQAQNKKLNYTLGKDSKSLIVKINDPKSKSNEIVTINSKSVVYVNNFQVKDYQDYFSIFEEKGRIFLRLPSSENIKSDSKNNVYNDTFVCRKKINKYVQLVLTKNYYKEILTFDEPKPQKKK